MYKNLSFVKKYKLTKEGFFVRKNIMIFTIVLALIVIANVIFSVKNDTYETLSRFGSSRKRSKKNTDKIKKLGIL